MSECECEDDPQIQQWVIDHRPLVCVNGIVVLCDAVWCCVVFEVAEW